jgi:TRAP-type C4-dicarboxylate transport system substrate-binding protein
MHAARSRRSFVTHRTRRPAVRRNTVKRGAQAALSAATIALVLVGCGGGSSDKAGGAQKPKPTVLTMADGNGGPGELEPFAAAARRLSGGTLRIEFKSAWRAGTSGYETGLIGDVKAGKADLGWAGSRAFDSVGVAAFDALHAPLLVDSYPLERRVLESPLVEAMLGGLKPFGVVGLGILPGPLRKPLGVSRLVRPADYAGKTLAFQRSDVAEQTFGALDARGAEIPSGGAIDGYDGIEQQVESIDNNGYDKLGKYLTSNVNLWPRPIVLFMNREAFNGLSGRQRAALRDAARVALPATLAAEQASEKEGAASLCRRGVTFVTAGNADLVALRRAVQPVYDRLQRDAQTKAAIEQIQAMRSQAAFTPDAPACSNTGSEQPGIGKATPIDGVYRVHTTPEDLRAAGASSGEVNPENYGSSKMVLDRGRVTQQQPAGDSAAGTYTVAGNTVTMTYTRSAGGGARTRPGEVWYFGWSRYRDQLTFAPVPGKVSPLPMCAKPWRRIGNAP